MPDYHLHETVHVWKKVNGTKCVKNQHNLEYFHSWPFEKSALRTGHVTAELCTSTSFERHHGCWVTCVSKLQYFLDPYFGLPTKFIGKDNFTWLPTTNSPHHGWYQTWTREAYLASNHTDSTKNTFGKSSNRHSLAKAMLSHHEQQRAWSVWICEHGIDIIDANLIINIQWKNKSDIIISFRNQPRLYPVIHILHLIKHMTTVT